MSEGNGIPILNITRKGTATFQFEGGRPFKVDLVLVANDWLEVDRAFRDDKGDVPNDRLRELNHAAWAFVNEFAKQSGVENLTMTEALQFLAMMNAEAEKLKVFFAPASPEQPSSRENITLTLSD